MRRAKQKKSLPPGDSFYKPAVSDGVLLELMSDNTSVF